MWLYAYGSRSLGRTAGTTVFGTPWHVRLDAPEVNHKFYSDIISLEGVRTTAVIPDDVSGWDAAAAFFEITQWLTVGLTPCSGSSPLDYRAKFLTEFDKTLYRVGGKKLKDARKSTTEVCRGD